MTQNDATSRLLHTFKNYKKQTLTILIASLMLRLAYQLLFKH